MPRRSILVVLPESSNDRIKVVDGVFDYAKTCRDWHVDLSLGDWETQPGQATTTELAGLILVRQVAPLPDAIRSWAIDQAVPLVMVQHRCDRAASVTTDSAATIELARTQWDQTVVKQLCLATRCSDDPMWSFVQSAAASMEISATKWVLPTLDRNRSNAAQFDSLCQRLVQQTDRTAVFATDTQLAIALRHAAARLAVPVPEQMSLISARDGLECALPSHSITAIEEPMAEMGYMAARLIDRIMQRQATPGQRIIVVPTQIHVRESCCGDFDHPSIALAANYIQQNAASGITVDDVLKTQETSRVTFERRFRQVTGQSPAEMIRMHRANRAKQLLLETDRTIADIAKACSFSTTSSFSTFFSKVEGISPLKFRRRFRKP